MDENALREMLERATREEPPMGQLPINALRKGIRLRRRRRAQSAATAAFAAIAVVGIVPALTTHGNSSTSARETAYVAAFPNRVVPVNLATDTEGQPIEVAAFGYSEPMAMAPNGRTLYVTSTSGLVTPINTTTNKAGSPINLHSRQLGGITIAPNGRTAYVTTSTGVIPVDLVTGKALHMITTRNPVRVVMGPSGKVAYVLGQQDVVPIRVATSTALRSIPVAWDSGIVFSPDGKTAYALSEHDKQRLGELIPISTTTNTVGKPIYLGAQADNVVGVPHSNLAYVEHDNGSIVPVNLATRTVGRLINAHLDLGTMTVSPDGKALYAFSFYSVSKATSGVQLTEISTVRGTLIKDIRIKGLSFVLFGISPDASTGFVAAAEGSVSDSTWRLVSIHLANNKVGRSILLGHQLPIGVVFTR